MTTHAELPPALLPGHLPVRGPEQEGARRSRGSSTSAPCCRRWTCWRARPAAARIKFFSKIEAWNSLRKHFHEDRAPEGLTFNKFLQTLQGLTDKKYGRGEMEKQGFTYKTLMVAGMHFMDSYNYDVERVKRCVIHYAAPNGQIYPFCAYNAGPTFREKIEKDFSTPFSSQPQLTQLRAGGNGCGGC